MNSRLQRRYDRDVFWRGDRLDGTSCVLRTNDCTERRSISIAERNESLVIHDTVPPTLAGRSAALRRTTVIPKRVARL